MRVVRTVVAGEHGAIDLVEHEVGHVLHVVVAAWMHLVRSLDCGREGTHATLLLSGAEEARDTLLLCLLVEMGAEAELG